jgi:hypothetical protein
MVNGDSVFFFLLPFVLDTLSSLPSELTWNCGSYKQLIRLLGLVITPNANPLSTQDNINTEEKRTDIQASNGIRTYNPSV